MVNDNINNNIIIFNCCYYLLKHTPFRVSTPIHSRQLIESIVRHRVYRSHWFFDCVLLPGLCNILGTCRFHCNGRTTLLSFCVLNRSAAVLSWGDYVDIREQRNFEGQSRRYTSIEMHDSQFTEHQWIYGA